VKNFYFNEICIYIYHSFRKLTSPNHLQCIQKYTLNYRIGDMRILITFVFLSLTILAKSQEVSPQRLVESARKEGKTFGTYALFTEENGSLRQYKGANEAFSEKKFFSTSPTRIRRLLDDAPNQFILILI